MNIHVGDDCIAMKASKVFLGMKLKKSCEHTVIRNCLLDKGHGGIVIGSEMSGGVKDMVVTQCLMDHTDRGLRVKTRRGRGNTAVIDGLVFRNVEMRGVKAPSSSICSTSATRTATAPMSSAAKLCPWTSTPRSSAP